MRLQGLAVREARGRGRRDRAGRGKLLSPGRVGQTSTVRLGLFGLPSDSGEGALREAASPALQAAPRPPPHTSPWWEGNASLKFFVPPGFPHLPDVIDFFFFLEETRKREHIPIS